MVINDLSDIKQKVFTFKYSLNRGINLSPSSMWNSIIQMMRTRIHLIIDNTCFYMYYLWFNKRMCDFQFHTSIIWSTDYSASIIESNIQCDVMK